VLLLVAALCVVEQLKDALNTVWEVDEPEYAGVWWYLRTYLVSPAGILGLGFLLAVSLVISTALTALSTWMGEPGTQSLVWHTMNFAVSLFVLGGLFAMLVRWFPDAAIDCADVWPGALASALLFNVGKLAIAWYLARQGPTARPQRSWYS
jgi:membrane protein